jgi:hypothetical protein
MRKALCTYTPLRYIDISVYDTTRKSLFKLVLLVAYVRGLSRIESEVADGSNEGVDSESNNGQNKVSESSAGVAFGLEAGVVDYQATDPTKEECE